MPESKKVVTGKARVQRESIWKKVASSFFMTDGKNIRDYMIDDLVVPLIKKGISGFVDLVLYGDVNRSNRNNGWWGNGVTRVGTPYNSIFQSSSSSQKPSANKKNSQTKGFQNLSFDFRADAENVLNKMKAEIEQFGLVSAGDMYDMADVSTDNFMLNKYGWTDLSNARVLRGADGFMIDLPQPGVLK